MQTSDVIERRPPAADSPTRQAADASRADCCATTDRGATLAPPQVRGALRPWLGGWRGGVVAGTLVIAAGLYLGWGWLAAVGAAPIILALAPCLVCCAAMGFGMCAMSKGPTQSPSAGRDQAVPTEIRDADTER